MARCVNHVHQHVAGFQPLAVSQRLEGEVHTARIALMQPVRGADPARQDARGATALMAARTMGAVDTAARLQVQAG